MAYFGNIRSLGSSTGFFGNTKFLGLDTLGSLYIQAQGGTQIQLGDWRYHIFNSTDTFTVSALSYLSANNNLRVLIVAGGGGGGADVGGGGSGGEVYENINYLLTSSGIKPVVVGAGGNGAPVSNIPGSLGSNSSFDGITSIGGGGGGSLVTGYPTQGAYGGGAVGYNVANNGANGLVAYKGGNNAIATIAATGGGGGGAGGNGQNSASAAGSFVEGGIGALSAINGYTYSKGGRGSSDSWSGGLNGIANSGNGGDGMGSPNTGKAGGSGIVIVGYYYPYDNTDADLYITNAVITNPTEQSAARDLFASLKINNLYTKMVALYPYLGGTSSTTKYNAINPLDDDGAYRIAWNGGLTFSSTGVLPNGTTGYGNTFISNNILGQDNMTLGVYSRTNIAVGSRPSQCAIGAYVAPNASAVYSGYYNSINSTYGVPTNTGTNSTRHFAVSRLNGTQENAVVNSGASATRAKVSVSTVNTQINIFRLGGFAGDYDVKESAFNYVATGMTLSELNIMTTIIDQFCVTTGRNV